MISMQNIFDRRLLAARRDRVAAFVSDSVLFREADLDIMGRLQLVDRDFTNILVIGARTGHLAHLLKKNYDSAKITITDISKECLRLSGWQNTLHLDEENISELPAGNFDLIIFPLGLHWINDVQTFLASTHSLLTSDGIFIASFIGAGSLKNLRSRFIEAESSAGQRYFTHIPPFIHFDQVASLCTEASFKSSVVDYEDIALEYKNPIALMRDIKNNGEANILSQRMNYAITKAVLANFSTKDSTSFKDIIRIINILASKEKMTSLSPRREWTT